MRIYICIDLKTFYASVECVERNLNPFETNLVVADPSRGPGSVCLAISPKMKMLGVKNRCRVYEIPKNIEYITAPPRMKKYIEYSTNIYGIYLKYFSKEDIHVYSIDEAFIDVTEYLKIYKKNALEIAKMVMKDVLDTYGITATCGIGTNLYLAKIALDIVSKHSPTNIGMLTESTYKEKLWHHKPLTDFWQIGRGIERRLNRMHLYDMYDIAHSDHQRLYKEFGINAEFLIDHSLGKETCTMKDIKNYKPKSTSVSNSQVLFKDYNFDDAKIIMIEMVENLSLQLIDENKLTSEIHLYVGYSKDAIPASGASKRLPMPTNTFKSLSNEYSSMYERIVNRYYPIRRIGLSLGRIENANCEQLNIFENQQRKEKERALETTINSIKTKMGRNSLIRAMDLEENATAIMRNKLIGGHNSG